MRPHGTPVALEARRRQALALLDAGVSQTDVCRRLGCTRMALWRWRAAREVQGSAGLTARPAPGRPRYLAPRQEARLLRLLAQGADAHGFTTALWTRQRVAALIAAEFGVGYHHDSIGRLLHRLGWSVQKPARRAAERDEAAIAHWRPSRRPQLKKKRPR